MSLISSYFEFPQSETEFCVWCLFRRSPPRAHIQPRTCDPVKDVYSWLLDFLFGSELSLRHHVGCRLDYKVAGFHPFSHHARKKPRLRLFLSICKCLQNFANLFLYPCIFRCLTLVKNMYQHIKQNQIFKSSLKSGNLCLYNILYCTFT